MVVELKTSLTKGLEADVKLEIEGLFIQSLLLRKRLSTLIQEKIDSSNAERLSKNNYENSSWAYKQADAVGYERALTEVLSLLE